MPPNSINPSTASPTCRTKPRSRTSPLRFGSLRPCAVLLAHSAACSRWLLPHSFEVNFNSGRFLKKADPYVRGVGWRAAGIRCSALVRVCHSSCRKFLRPLLATQAFMSFIDDAARVGEVFPSHVTDPAALGAMFHQMVGEFHRQDDAQDAAEIQLFDLCTRLNEHATNGTISRPAFVGGHQSPGRGRGRYTASEILELLENTGGHAGSKPSVGCVLLIACGFSACLTRVWRPRQPAMDVDVVLRAANHRAALDRPEHLLAEQMWHTGMARVLPAPAADDDASQVPAVGTLPQLDDATLEHFGLYNQPDDDDDVDGDALSPVAPPASEPTEGSGDADTQSAPASPPAIGRARALSRTALAREFSVGDDPLLASDNVTIGEEAPRGLAGDTASAAVPRVRAESATSSIGATSNSSGGGSLRALSGTQSGRSRRAGRRSSMLLTGMDINRGSTVRRLGAACATLPLILGVVPSETRLRDDAAAVHEDARPSNI